MRPQTAKHTGNGDQERYLYDSYPVQSNLTIKPRLNLLKTYKAENIKTAYPLNYDTQDFKRMIDNKSKLR